MRKQRQQTGFTLIEVMIVVAIIAIISAIAYPSYMEQVRKSRRSDAQIKLQELAQLQESFFTRNMSYASSLSGLLGGSEDTIESDERFYQLNISSATNSGGGACSGDRTSPCATYTLQAVPVTGTSQVQDVSCSRYTLDSMGRKAANGASPADDTTEQCW